MKIPKKWGYEKVLVNNELYCAKLLVLSPGWQCSLHRHKEKDETFIILKGWCMLEYGNERRAMKVNATQRIPPGTFHRFALPKAERDECTILEVSTHHKDEDVERREESRRYDGKGVIAG